MDQKQLKELLNTHMSVIESALKDYRNWFDDSWEEELPDDQFKLEEIDAALEFLNKLRA